jgi:EAL domain-containing protein (putative c-di-GMP-specific phosphodiesterase class I)
VVAEGIETEGQLQQLREMGCGCGQGYLLGRPQTPGEVSSLLARRLPDGLLHGALSMTTSAPITIH